jgi:hypothetical protein
MGFIQWGNLLIALQVAVHPSEGKVFPVFMNQNTRTGE